MHERKTNLRKCLECLEDKYEISQKESEKEMQYVIDFFLQNYQRYQIFSVQNNYQMINDHLHGDFA